MLRPAGCLLILVAGAPTYLAIGFLDQLGRMGVELEIAITVSTIPASFVVDWIFFRDLAVAIDSPQSG